MKREEERKKKLSALERIDNRILFTILFVLAAYPLMAPMGLPLQITAYTKGYFGAIEALPKGAKVLLTNDYDPTYVGEMYPITAATVEHLIKKEIQFVGVSVRPFGAMMLDKALVQSKASDRRVYGKDYVLVGFIPGEAVGAQAFARDIQSLVRNDYYGKAISSLPLMQGIKSGADFDLLVVVYAQVEFGGAWITQITDPMKKSTVAALNGANSVSGYGFLKANLIQGLLVGLRGAAEYEKLIGNPGSAVSFMDAQTILHVAAIVLIGVGNVGYFSKRLRGGKQ